MVKNNFKEVIDRAKRCMDTFNSEFTDCKVMDNRGNSFTVYIIRRNCLESFFDATDSRSYLNTIIESSKIQSSRAQRTSIHVKEYRNKVIKELIRDIDKTYVTLLSMIHVANCSEGEVVEAPECDIVSATYTSRLDGVTIGIKTKALVSIAERADISSKLWRKVKLQVHLNRVHMRKDENKVYSILVDNYGLVSSFLSYNMCSVISLTVGKVILHDAGDQEVILSKECVAANGCEVWCGDKRYKPISKRLNGEVTEHVVVRE